MNGGEKKCCVERREKERVCEKRENKKTFVHSLKNTTQHKGEKGRKGKRKGKGKKKNE